MDKEKRNYRLVDAIVIPIIEVLHGFVPQINIRPININPILNFNKG